MLPSAVVRALFHTRGGAQPSGRAVEGRRFDMLGPVVYRAGWTGDFTRAGRESHLGSTHGLVSQPCNSNVLGNGESGGLVVVWSPRHRLRRIARRVQVAGAADAASNLKNTMRTPALPHLMFERSKEGWTPCRPCMTCPVDRFRSCVLRATAAWDGTAQWMWRRRFR